MIGIKENQMKRNTKVVSKKGRIYYFVCEIDGLKYFSRKPVEGKCDKYKFTFTKFNLIHLAEFSLVKE